MSETMRLVTILSADVKDLNAKMAMAEKRTRATSRKMNAYASQIQGYIAGAFAVSAVVQFARAQINLVKELDRSNKALKAITETSVEYNRAKSMLAVSAEKYGVNILDLTKSYVRFSAAAKASSLSTRELDKIFNSVTKSAALLGLSGDEVHGVLKALEQMMSKGKVQAEELRGQLGDRLPGAFVIMADSMGVTTAELDKMLKVGGVMADEVLPKFAVALEKAYGADQLDRIETLSGAMERSRSAWTNFMNDLEEGEGIISGLVKGFHDWKTTIINNYRLLERGVGLSRWYKATEIMAHVEKQEADAAQKRADRIKKETEALMDEYFGRIKTEEDLNAVLSRREGVISVLIEGEHRLTLTEEKLAYIQNHYKKITKQTNDTLKDQAEWQAELDEKEKERI